MRLFSKTAFLGRPLCSCLRCWGPRGRAPGGQGRCSPRQPRGEPQRQALSGEPCGAEQVPGRLCIGFVIPVSCVNADTHRQMEKRTLLLALQGMFRCRLCLSFGVCEGGSVCLSRQVVLYLKDAGSGLRGSPRKLNSTLKPDGG